MGPPHLDGAAQQRIETLGRPGPLSCGFVEQTLEGAQRFVERELKEFVLRSEVVVER